MRHQLRVAIVIGAASVALSACSDRSTSVPTSPAIPPATVVAASASLTPLACDITALKADARNFARSGSDPLFKIIGDLQTAVKNGPVSAATDKAFDGLARMAAIRGTADQATGVAGAVFDRLVHRFLGCADPAIASGADEQNFGGALGSGWAFEVRGKTTDPAGGAYERGSTTGNWWAAEAVGTWADAITTSTLTADRVLIYGYETNFLTVSGRFGGSSFEHRTIPKIASGTFALSVNVGLCVPNGTGITSTQRLNHNNTLVPLINTLTCATPASFTATSGSLALGRINPLGLAKRAWGFLAPQTAFAAFAVGSVGGAVSELSPSAVYNLSNVLLSELGTVADGKNSVPLATTTAVGTYGKAVIIRAKDADGTPLQGVPIEMSIAGNNSNIAFFSENGGPAVATVTRTTDPNGYANYGDVSLTKAGGYTLNFRVNFNGVTGTATPSNAFNIQNK